MFEDGTRYIRQRVPAVRQRVPAARRSITTVGRRAPTARRNAAIIRRRLPARRLAPIQAQVQPFQVNRVQNVRRRIPLPSSVLDFDERQIRKQSRLQRAALQAPQLRQNMPTLRVRNLTQRDIARMIAEVGEYTQI